MSLASKVVLTLPLSGPDALESFVQRCLADGVELVCIAGSGAAEVEEAIDWLVVGDGSDRSRTLITTAHPDEPLDEVMAFAADWDSAVHGAPEVVRL